MDIKEAEDRAMRCAAMCRMAWERARIEPTFEDAAKLYATLLTETVYRTLRVKPEPLEE